MNLAARDNFFWQRHIDRFLWIGGIVLVLFFVFVLGISSKISTDIPMKSRLDIILVGIIMVVGIPYALVALKIDFITFGKQQCFFINGLIALPLIIAWDLRMMPINRN